METDSTNYKCVVETLNFLIKFFTQNHLALNHLPAWLWDETRGGIDFKKFEPLLQAAQEEIQELERWQRALTAPSGERLLTEHYILSYSALRIDGYKYCDETNLDARGVLDHFFASGNFGKATALDKLACFFLLQRYLCKWGGEYLAENSTEWRAYRELFLQTVSVEVPAEFRLEGRFASKWEYRIKPNLSECINIVKEIHQQTAYEG